MTVEEIKQLPNWREPVPGEDICVSSSWYLSHGRDDFDGGLCQIGKVVKSDKLPEDHINGLMVTIVERPGWQYNWYNLIKNEKQNLERYGSQRGRPNPDMDPSANEWW